MVEEARKGLQTTWEARIDVEFGLPVDAKRLTVLQANRAKAECVLNI